MGMLEKFNRVQVLSWTATVVLIIGSGINGLGYYPLGPMILALGGFMWLAVAFATRNWPLIVTNLVMSAVGIGTITYGIFRGTPAC